MKLHKLESTDAFVVFDLDAAPRSVGIVRQAPKLLIDGATMLARTNTYAFATFEQQIGGASAGINAKPDGRADAIAAFDAEVAGLTDEGALVLAAGKGIGGDELPSVLTAADPSLLEASAITAAAAVRPLDGASVLVEGLDGSNVSLLSGLAGAGAKVIGVATLKGAVINPDGLDAAGVADALRAKGAEGIYDTGEVHPAAALLRTPADVLFVGSKAGAIDHEHAENLQVGLVAPIGPVPVTAKALAVLRRAGTVVLPDFITASGPALGLAGIAADAASVSSLVTAALPDVLAHEDGPLLAACYRAEAFLRTWREELPFGRPLA